MKWMNLALLCDIGTFRTGIKECAKVQKILEPHKEKRCTGRWANQNKVSALCHRDLVDIVVLISSCPSTKCIRKHPVRKLLYKWMVKLFMTSKWQRSNHLLKATIVKGNSYCECLVRLRLTDVQETYAYSCNCKIQS